MYKSINELSEMIARLDTIKHLRDTSTGAAFDIFKRLYLEQSATVEAALMEKRWGLYEEIRQAEHTIDCCRAEEDQNFKQIEEFKKLTSTTPVQSITDEA